jgi:hypothetical protein
MESKNQFDNSALEQAEIDKQLRALSGVSARQFFMLQKYS